MLRALIGYSRCMHTKAALEKQGFHVITCDLLPSNDPDHYQGDVFDLIYEPWDFGVLHPMCTYLTVSAAWAMKDPDYDRYPEVGYHQKVKPGTLTGAERREAHRHAVEEFKQLDGLDFPKVIENPAPSMLSRAHRPPDQIVQPHQFGDDASKGTGLWISKLPKLKPTKFVEPRMVNGRPRWANQTDSGQNKVTPSENRWIERSKTYPGIANAIGVQMGGYIAAQAA